jgi:asparagine synthase (glutamine-hydrolysing)
MCGIFALLNNVSLIGAGQISDSFRSGSRRGPETSSYASLGNLVEMGFHRLAINGIDPESGQPMTIDGITLICNGEIYNYKELYEIADAKPKTNSDCEIIIHLYKKHGIEYTLNLLDGVFGFMLYDARGSKEIIHVARDPYGVRPLYTLHCKSAHEPVIAFASELKALAGLTEYNSDIKHVVPGSYSSFTRDSTPGANKYWTVSQKETKYTELWGNTSMLFAHPSTTGLWKVHMSICQLLNNAVRKRVCGTCDRPIACLLSGGLDSSLITALVNKYYDGILETYSIGMEGSKDLANAKCVAEHLGTKHTQIVVTAEDFFSAIPEVIETIESYDTTTVRASVGNYLIGKYIAEHSDAKVIFNGDGSDELTGGYLYFLEAPDDFEFDKECRRLLKDIHAFDVLRSDKCISSHGLEPRTPFLDRMWVQFYLELPLSIRNPMSHYTTSIDCEYGEKKNAEKYLLRKAFSVIEPSLLPQSIIWRTKEAFSDGVSGQDKSWFEIISDKLDSVETVRSEDNCPVKIYSMNPPTTKEQTYYREIYDKAYPDTAGIVPYFWMPRFVDATDSSARTLSVYSRINKIPLE